MKVLFLTPRLPYPPIGGDKLRIYHQIRLLSPRLEHIHLLSLIEAADEREAARRFEAEFPNLTVETVFLPRWRSYLSCAEGLFTRDPLQVCYYRSARFVARLEGLLASQAFDACVMHLFRMAQYGHLLAGVRTVLELTDCLSLRYRRSAPYARGISRLLDGIERRRVSGYETRATGRVDASVVVTEADRDELVRLGAKGAIEVINNGVDTEFFHPRPTVDPEPRTAAFLGNLHSFPNRDAVEFIVREIWPLVRRVEPRAGLQIIGTHPTRRIRGFDGRDGVVVTGRVDDVRPYLWRSALTLAPVRVGAGTQNKILESLALGVPAITTSVGFEGLGMVPGEGVLVANEPDAIAECVLRVFADADLRHRLSVSGRGFVEANYDWDEKGRRIYGVLNGSPPPEPP